MVAGISSPDGCRVRDVEGGKRPQSGSLLDQAYRQANYIVLANPPFILRIGQPSTALAGLYQRLKCTQCIFLSACNPRSRILRPAANTRRMRSLNDALLRQGWLPLAGEGRDPGGHWPPEASLLVPGLNVSQAMILARRYGQNAFVTADASCIPQLVWVPR